MDILKQNTSPIFEIVPRKTLDVFSDYKFKIINETANKTQEVLASVSELPNENYQVLLASFPNGKIGEKLSYKLVENLTDEIVYLGKIIIVSENENIQDYSKITNNKFYKWK